VVPLAGVRVPHEGEHAAAEWFRDGVSELARAPLYNVGERWLFCFSAQQPKPPAVRAAGPG
jgi:hypothetical protein